MTWKVYLPILSLSVGSLMKKMQINFSRQKSVKIVGTEKTYNLVIGLGCISKSSYSNIEQDYFEFFFADCGALGTSCSDQTRNDLYFGLGRLDVIVIFFDTDSSI